MNKYIILAQDGTEYDSVGNDAYNLQVICLCTADNKREALEMAYSVLDENELVYNELIAKRLHDDEKI